MRNVIGRTENFLKRLDERIRRWCTQIDTNISSVSEKRESGLFVERSTASSLDVVPPQYLRHG